MKSAVYAVLLTAVVVFSCCEASTSPTSTIDKGTGDSTTNSSLSSSKTYPGTTETAHTMVPTESTTSGNFSSEIISSVTSRPHTGSDATSSVSASTTTQLTDSSGPTESITTMSSIPTTPSGCPEPSGFDAASFVGGIILALGVMVILVIIVKCYQHRMNKSELQYSQF